MLRHGLYCAFALSLLLPGPAAASEARRILVLDVSSEGVPDELLERPRAQLQELIRKRAGFQVAEGAGAPAADCRAKAECLAELGRAAHAQLVLDAVLKEDGGRYTLTTQLVDAGAAKVLQQATESMKRLKSLPANLELCLDRMIKALPAPAPAEGATAPEPAAVAAPVAAGSKHVLVLDLKVAGLESKVGAALPALIAQEIARHPGYNVSSTDDVQRLMSHEAQKQVVGCSQDDACMVEVSKKLQADLIVNGSVGKVGESLVLNLALVNPKDLGKATGAMETVARVEDLPRAVAPCLAKLFHWDGAQNAAFHLPKGKKLSFAVLDLRPTGISAVSAQNLTQVLSVTVKSIEGASVISREDIAAMLQLDAAKMSAGCADDSCMAQIGGALGVDRLISGDVGLLGEQYIVNLRLIDVRHGEVENRITETYHGDEEQLLRAVRHAGHALLGLPIEGAGRLAVTATQNAAAVFVDEDKKGQTPIPIDNLKVGRHEVRVAHDGFFDWRGEVYIDPTETTSVWAQLKERPQSWYQKWWVWTIAGAVVVGATVTTVALTRPPATVGTGSVTLQ